MRKSPYKDGRPPCYLASCKWSHWAKGMIEVTAVAFEDKRDRLIPLAGLVASMVRLRIGAFYRSWRPTFHDTGTDVATFEKLKAPR